MKEGVAVKISTVSKSFLVSLVALALMAVSFASYAQVLGTASLNVERRGHTATQLKDGKILVAGGENTGGVVNQAEVCDPATHVFLIVGTSAGRTDHTATLLSDGRVLLPGGRDQVSGLDSTEIFNPADNSFSPGPSMKRARGGHSATVLSDGRILLAGGDAQGSAEIYDPAAELFTVGPLMTEPRALHGAALLQDGSVLIAGGVDPVDSAQLLDSAEIFDPRTGRFVSALTTMGIARGLPAIRVLPDGKVQVIGGDSEWSMEMFNPETGAFNALAHLPPTPDLVAATLSTQARAALISTTIAENPAMQAALQDQQISQWLDRAGHSLTEMPGRNQALVAGGADSRGGRLTSPRRVGSSGAALT